MKVAVTKELYLSRFYVQCDYPWSKAMDAESIREWICSNVALCDSSLSLMLWCRSQMGSPQHLFGDSSDAKAAR